MPRKTHRRGAVRGPFRWASMRPRPDAAENGDVRPGDVGRGCWLQ